MLVKENANVKVVSLDKPSDISKKVKFENIDLEILIIV